MNIQIKSIFTGAVLFDHDAENNSIKLTVELAVKARANLAGAYLARANLDGANLAGAYLDGANLAGKRPIFQVGPIGSRCAYLVSFLTTVGIKIMAGCFFGSRDEFAAKVDQEHGDSIHGDEYRAALALIDAHARLWIPAKEQAKEEA